MGIKMSGRRLEHSNKTWVSRLRLLAAGGALVVGLIAGGSINKPVSPSSFGKFFSPNVALARNVNGKNRVKQGLTDKMKMWVKEAQKYRVGEDTNLNGRFITRIKFSLGGYTIVATGNVYKNQKDKSGIAFRILKNGKIVYEDVVKFDGLPGDLKQRLESLAFGIQKEPKTNPNFVKVWAVLNGKIEGGTAFPAFKFDQQNIETYNKPVKLASAK